MRTSARFALAACVVLSAAHAHAAITVSAMEVPNIDINLQKQGWTGYLISLHADSASQKITTVEFANNLLNLPVPVGIRGVLHQRWIRPAVSSSTGTPTPASTLTGPANDGTETDSYFLNSGYYNVSVANPFTEDNNLTNVISTPPFNGSPLVDENAFQLGKAVVPGSDYGIGSHMTFTGAASQHTATNTLNLAFVIVPKGGDVWSPGINPSAFAYVAGVAIDPFNNAYPITLAYPAWIVFPPEPGSLGTLAVGAFALLARRRAARNLTAAAR